MNTKRNRCTGHPGCPMTAGYYIGGGQWICWFHALCDRVIWEVIVRTKQQMQALPQQESHV
jgi:hypothetical protein